MHVSRTVILHDMVFTVETGDYIYTYTRPARKLSSLSLYAWDARITVCIKSVRVSLPKTKKLSVVLLRGTHLLF
jgi:hypothetical protein